MRIKAVFVLLIAAAVANAKSYTVNLYQAATFGEVELAPGEYKVEVNDGKAVIRNGKVHGESTVKVEDGADKFDRTTVRFDNAGGKTKIQEIRLGGTKTRLVFSM
jgi:hypothetical protein